MCESHYTPSRSQKTSLQTAVLLVLVEFPFALDCKKSVSSVVKYCSIFRFVDDILITYSENHGDINKMVIELIRVCYVTLKTFSFMTTLPCLTFTVTGTSLLKQMTYHQVDGVTYLSSSFP